MSHMGIEYGNNCDKYSNRLKIKTTCMFMDLMTPVNLIKLITPEL